MRVPARALLESNLSDHARGYSRALRICAASEVARSGRLSAEQLRLKGFSRLYSRIWWTNVASLRVSEKAGWSHVGTTLQVTLPGVRRPLDLAFGKSRKSWQR